MNNNVQGVAEERDGSKANAFIEISLIMAFVLIIIFSAFILLG
jgi:hypothetical protein